MSSDSRELSPYRILRDPLPPEEAYAATGGFASEEFHLRDYWRVLRKHRSVIASSFLVLVTIAGFVTFRATPLYTATATIQIDRQAPKMAPVQEVQQIDALAYDKYDYYQTQYEILGSRSIAARVIQALGLQSDERFVGKPASPGVVGASQAFVMDRVRSVLPRGAGSESAKPAGPDPFGVDTPLINRYLGMLAIDPVRNSRLVRISFTSGSPAFSAEIANKHVEAYMDASLEQRLGMTLKAKEFLETELAKAKDRVAAAEAALNSFRKQNDVISLDGDLSDIVSGRLGELNTLFTEAQAERIRLEGQYRLIRERSYESLPDVASSSFIAALKQELANVEVRRADLAKKFKPGYPKMAEVIARERQLRERIDAEVGKVVDGIESAYLAAKNREEALAAQLEAQRQAALAQKDVGADYDTLKRDVETARDLYANLLQRLKDVDVAEEIKVSNVSLVDRASAPLFASSPNKRRNLTFAGILGLMLGVGLALFLEYIDNTLKTPEDVERRLGLPTLGVVPSFETPALAYGNYGQGSRSKRHGSKRRGSSPGSKAADAASGALTVREQPLASGPGELVVSTHPRSVIAEAYRTIRTGVLLSSADSPPQVMLFTSGAAGEGKTVTAVNQALTLVQAGARVLIVDADIRKPRLHRIFGLPNGHGLSTYLAGQSELEGVIHEIQVDQAAKARGVETGRMFALPAGPTPPNPAELVGSQRMRHTIEQLRQEYDYIVIDTPPVLPVTDAVLLATMSDGVVLVVRGQETPVDVATKSRDRLAYARAKILGVVLNDVDVMSGDYSHYHRYYYSYYASSESAAPDA